MSSEGLKTEKITMYRNLEVKTLMTVLKELYSLIACYKNLQTLEETINTVSEENNLNYDRKMTQSPNHLLMMNRSSQAHHFQMPGRHLLSRYKARTTTALIRHQ